MWDTSPNYLLADLLNNQRLGSTQASRHRPKVLSHHKNWKKFLLIQLQDFKFKAMFLNHWPWSKWYPHKVLFSD